MQLEEFYNRVIVCKGKTVFGFEVLMNKKYFSGAGEKSQWASS